jgi:peptide deformylase
MILPIVAYGNPVLREEGADLPEEMTDELQQLIDNMFDTLEAAGGIGLAAPQVGKALQLFVINVDGEREVFINPIIVEERGEPIEFEEGCLSIPGIYESVTRKSEITIEYFNKDLKLMEKSYDGMLSRVIQHEYDHINGILFIDHLSTLRRQMIKKSLNLIARGKINPRYRMVFVK